MHFLTLSCGPFFREDGLAISLVMFVIFQPLAYFAFINAFRFRVSRSIPMTTGQAIKLAAIRAVLGLAIVGGGAGAIWILESKALWNVSWVFLYVERLAVWGGIGRYVDLRGRRLVGWIISGTLLNAAFDAALVIGAMSGYVGPVLILIGIFVFISALHIVGRRDSLKARFAAHPVCANCQYNLTGNLSGVCPECGTPIGGVAAQPA